MIDVDRLRRLIKKASNGSWGVETGPDGAAVTHCPHGADCVNSRHDPYVAEVVGLEADADYIAAVSPEKMTELLDELESLRGWADAAKNIMEHMHSAQPYGCAYEGWKYHDTVSCPFSD